MNVRVRVAPERVTRLAAPERPFRSLAVRGDALLSLGPADLRVLRAIVRNLTVYSYELAETLRFGLPQVEGILARLQALGMVVSTSNGLASGRAVPGRIFRPTLEGVRFAEHSRELG
jgi:hypothetical protein